MIRLDAVGAGDWGHSARYRVALASGTEIGSVVQTLQGQFAVRVPVTLTFFGCLAGPAGGGVGFLLGLAVFLVTCASMSLKGARNIANRPSRENAYARR